MDRKTATLMYAGRNRKSSMRRTVPLTKRASGGPVGIGKTGIFPAPAVPRRSSLTRSPPSRKRSRSRRHLGPQEPGELPRDRGGDDGLGVLTRGEPAEPRAEPELRSPRSHHRLAREPVVAPAHPVGDARVVPVGRRRLHELPTDVGVAGLGDPSPPGSSPLEYSDGTSPQNPMSIWAEAKRRKSQTSEAKVSAPSWSTPRYAASLATCSAKAPTVNQGTRPASIEPRSASRASSTAR